MNRIVSFKKLWHMLIDRDMNKNDLKRIAGISSSTLANMVADKNVSMDVLLKICTALDCDFVNIIEAKKYNNESEFYILLGEENGDKNVHHN